MIYQTVNFVTERRYKVFHVGEKVKANSPRSSLFAPGHPDSEYVVSKFVHPGNPDDYPVVFVEGRGTGVDGSYLDPVDDSCDRLVYKADWRSVYGDQYSFSVESPDLETLIAYMASRLTEDTMFDWVRREPKDSVEYEGGDGTLYLTIREDKTNG